MIYIHWLFLALYTILATIAIITVLLEHRQPAKTMVWILVLSFLPIPGIVLYFFFGQRTRKKRHIWQRGIDQLTKRSMLEFAEQENLKLPPQHRTLIDLFTNQNRVMPFKNNETEIFTDGYGFAHALLTEIGRAVHHIHIITYIIEDDPFGNLIADALIDKAREDVEIRLVYDDVGSWRTHNRFFERMREEGIEVQPFMQVRFPLLTSKVNYRNHRKIAVFDGRVGFIGGMNIARRYISQKWRDTHVKITGAAVYGLQRAFLLDWFLIDKTLISNRAYYPTAKINPNNQLIQIVTSNPTDRWPEIEQGYIKIILSAKQYVYMQTPYFLPTEPILFALRTAAVSGVDVRLMLPLHTDTKLVEWASRSYVMDTVQAGVKVVFYKNGFNHSKLLVTDDSLSTVGSSNIDFRSFENNFEANAFFYDEKIALKIKHVFLEDEQNSIPLEHVRSLTDRSFLQRLWESIVRLLSPLL